jgi:hypothetical protein
MAASKSRFLAWQISFGLALLSLSVTGYVVYYTIFSAQGHMFEYLLSNLAFLPIQVLFVTLLIDRMLREQEKQALVQKMRMAIGVFFSEVGHDFLKFCVSLDPDAATLAKILVPAQWSGKGLQDIKIRIRNRDARIEVQPPALEDLQEFLAGRRPFLTALLANPNLLEHDSFTGLLWAVFHLAEELSYRKDVTRLPAADCEHLAGDIKRAYAAVTLEWIDHMAHLKQAYPYLFALAVRTNPFDPSARPEVTE